MFIELNGYKGMILPQQLVGIARIGAAGKADRSLCPVNAAVHRGLLIFRDVRLVITTKW